MLTSHGRIHCAQGCHSKQLKQSNQCYRLCHCLCHWRTLSEAEAEALPSVSVPTLPTLPTLPLHTLYKSMSAEPSDLSRTDERPFEFNYQLIRSMLCLLFVMFVMFVLLASCHYHTYISCILFSFCSINLLLISFKILTSNFIFLSDVKNLRCDLYFLTKLILCDRSEN